MEPPLIVVGAGGHAKVLIETMQLTGRSVLFATDNEAGRHGDEILGVPVKGTDDCIFEHTPDSVQLVNGVGSSDVPELHQRVFEQLVQHGYRFASVIHPTAIISPTATLGQGVQIMAGAVIQCGATLGVNVLINTRASVGHDCTISDHVHISSGATLGGTTHIGRNTHVGTGASIIQCLRIGANTLIGAGAVVVEDLPDNVRAWGVPARVRTPQSAS